MEELNIFWSVLMGICAAVIAFGGAGAVIAKLFAAPMRVQKQIEEHDEELKQSRKENAITLECILQMMNHMIDGNHTDQLICTRDKLQQFLIER